MAQLPESDPLKPNQSGVRDTSRRLRFRYLLALGLIAGLSLSSQALSLYETAAPHTDLLGRTAWALLAVTVMALLVAAVLVFEPAVRLIRRQSAEIRRLLGETQVFRSRAEEVKLTLQRSEERYRDLVENAHALIVCVDEQGRFVYLSPNVEEILGYNRDRFVVRRSWWDFIHPEDLPRLLEIYREAMQAEPGYSAQVEYRARHRDGSFRWFEGVGRTFRSSDGTLRAVAIASDISERKHAEEASRIANERLRTLITNAPVLLFTLDREGTCTLCEGKGLEAVGHKPSDFAGQSIAELFEGLFRDEPQIRANIDRALAGDEFTAVLEYRGRVAETHYAPLRSESGEIEGVTGVATDITERLRAEEERERLEAQMRHSQKLESLGVLAGGIAHDFNNLLMTILGNADLALTDATPGDSARASIDRIRVAARRAADLTNQLLSYAGRGQVKVEPLDLSKLMESTGELLKVSISKTVVLHHELAERLPLIDGDAAQITQVILNLITNASEALDEETGSITIRTGVIDVGRTYASQTYPPGDLREGTYVYLEVSDTGAGMDAATKSKIFEPFFTTKLSGRGLGLAAVLGIVHAHHGALSVQSEPGEGTTFRVLFPILERLAEARSEASTSTEEWPGSGTVLVVEDEEEVQNVAEEMLRRLGFEVMSARDGREAVENFRVHSGDVVAVLLDMTMPELSGEETFRQIRRIRPEAPVVFMSGYSDECAESHLRDGGLAEFLHKPFTIEELGSTLRGILERKTLDPAR